MAAILLPLQCTTETDTTVVVFKSTLFCSSFGAGLLIAPNTIDFGSVFHDLGAKLLANIHVLVTLCGLIILFLCLLPYARYRDRKDRHNVSIYNVWLHFNSLWLSDAIWRQGSGSTLAQVMACCLTAPSHYLNQSWLIIIKVKWH